MGLRSPLEQLFDEVIDRGLCTHCGTCAGLSSGGLALSQTRAGMLPVRPADGSFELPPEAVEACPGRGLNYPSLTKFVFGRQPGNWLLGNYEDIWVGHSNSAALRRNGSSGGVITHTLAYLLQEGRIDGAVVLRHGFPEPWLSSPIIATTLDEIIASSQSVYVPVPVNAILQQMDEFPGRLAYVGLPDQVASLRRLQQLGHRGAKKVKYVIGPYVGTLIYLQGLESFLSSSGIGGLKDVKSLQYRAGEWPGNLVVESRDGRRIQAKKFYYNYLIPFYITKSTLYSPDFANELTDLSIGDAWSPEYEAKGAGFSVVIARSPAAAEIMGEMRVKGMLELEELPLNKALEMHGHMLDFKKRGSYIRMSWRKATGRIVPDYGIKPINIPLSRYLVEGVISGVILACQTRLARFVVGLVPLAIIGPLFDGLRKTWKWLSKPTKRRALMDLTFEPTDTPREVET